MITLSSFVRGDLLVALSCEHGMQEKNKKMTYILIYGDQSSNESFHQVCKSELNTESLNPFSCFENVQTNANIIKAFSDASSINYSLEINRKTLAVTDKYSQRGNTFYYQCIKSTNPEILESIIIEKKRNQLNENQL